MSFAARVVLDSISPLGVRLTTLEVTLPRFTLAEVNTHRVFSRNSASSRAIRTERFIESAVSDPVIPLEWGFNERGMSATEALPPELQAEALRVWLDARDDAVKHAKRMLALNVHKQHANRLLEPFLWHTVVISSTTYANFLAQRLSTGAQPEIREAARLMHELLVESKPTPLAFDEWHLPFVRPEERALPLHSQQLLSIARCARTSFLGQNGTRGVQEDFNLALRLEEDGHWSPFEHQGTPLPDLSASGNFIGWKQLRKGFVGENIARYGKVA